MTHVSVIIPTHNRPHGLARALQSVRSQDHVREIVVVDDGSEPPAAAPPNVRLVRVEGPRLVSAARNIGAARATSELLLFIDDDCELEEGAVDAMVNMMISDDRIFMVGPCIVYRSDPQYIWCAGNISRPLTGRTILRAHGELRKRRFSLPPDCESFPSVFLIRAEAFREVGGFDQARFPMHCEEAELAVRLRSAGGRVSLAHSAVARHDIAREQGLRRRFHITSDRTAFFVGRGRTLFILSDCGPSTRKATRMLFWLTILVPTYVASIAADSTLSLASRRRYVSRFLRGVGTGLTRRL